MGGILSRSRPQVQNRPLRSGITGQDLRAVIVGLRLVSPLAFYSFKSQLPIKDRMEFFTQLSKKLGFEVTVAPNAWHLATASKTVHMMKLTVYYNAKRDEHTISIGKPEKTALVRFKPIRGRLGTASYAPKISKEQIRSIRATLHDIQNELNPRKMRPGKQTRPGRQTR